MQSSPSSIIHTVPLILEQLFPSTSIDILTTIVYKFLNILVQILMFLTKFLHEILDADSIKLLSIKERDRRLSWKNELIK